MKKNLLNFQYPASGLQLGQTLIETLVAIFILVMGVTAAVGLAIYAFNSSSSITKQIIATGLAREGVEAVKNMRDNNWLKDSLATNCYDYTSTPIGQATAKCYLNWLHPIGGYDIRTNSFRLEVNGLNSSQLWQLTPAVSNWGLDFNGGFNCNSGGVNFCGFYGVNDISTGSVDGTSDYYRQIIITQDHSTAPYNARTDGSTDILTVESRVWWADKKCGRSQTWPGPGKCSISIQTQLTNWKDY